MNTLTQLTQAKDELREILAQYDRNTQNKTVLAAIEKLSKLHPIQAPARQEKLMDGHWSVISKPSFPGGERLEDGSIAYTLGHLSLNIFQPSSLKLVLEEISQSILPINDGETGQRNYENVLKWKSIEPKYQQIKGIVRTLGICQLREGNLLELKCTGGILEPLPNTDLQIWKQIFQQCNQPQQRSWLDKSMLFLPQLMFGLELPQAMDEETGKIVFTVKKAPVGKLSILFVDDELCIAKDELGSVLVCEKRMLL